MITPNSTMNPKIENLLYQAGITAQGCWDELDSYAKDAILRLITITVDATVLDCSSRVQTFVDCRVLASEYPQLLKSQYDLS